MIRSLWMQSAQMGTTAIRSVIGLLASLAVGPHRKNHHCLIHQKTVNHAVSLATSIINTHILSRFLSCLILKNEFYLNIRNAIGCGIANKQRRIVGGQETEVNQYPWMALLTYGNRFYCGATLINGKKIADSRKIIEN